MPKNKFYAIANGRQTGIVTNWDSCRENVTGYKGAVFKSFNTEAEAKAYLASNSRSSSSSSSDSYSYSGSSHKPSHYDYSGSNSHSSSYHSPPTQYSSSSHSYDSYSSSSSSSSNTSYSSSSNSSHSNSSYPNSSYSSESSQTSHVSDAPKKKRSITQGEGDVDPSPAAKRSKPVQPQVIYTDGACQGNGQHFATAGYGVYFGRGDKRNISEPLPGPKQTNQRAELMAAVKALESVPHDQPVEIRSDSKYLIKGVTEWMPNWDEAKWAKVQNHDLFTSLKHEMDKRAAPTTFTYVKAHSGEPGNEAADALAVSGTRKSNIS